MTRFRVCAIHIGNMFSAVAAASSFRYQTRDIADFYAASEIRVADTILDRDVLFRIYASMNRSRTRASLRKRVASRDMKLRGSQQNRYCRSYHADSVDRFFIFFCRLLWFSTTLQKGLLLFGSHDVQGVYF